MMDLVQGLFYENFYTFAAHH